LYLEIMALFSSVAMIFNGIVLIYVIPQDLFLAFFLLAAIFLVLIGNMVIGYKITSSDLKPIMDPTPKGKELMEWQQIDGRVRFINTTKGALGKRSWRSNGEDASVFNDGKTNFKLPNGNTGFRAHENFDRNIDPKKAKALQNMEGDDIKEIYFQARDKLDKEAKNG